MEFLWFIFNLLNFKAFINFQMNFFLQTIFLFNHHNIFLSLIHYLILSFSKNYFSDSDTGFA